MGQLAQHCATHRRNKMLSDENVFVVTRLCVRLLSLQCNEYGWELALWNFWFASLQKVTISANITQYVYLCIYIYMYIYIFMHTMVYRFLMAGSKQSFMWFVKTNAVLAKVLLFLRLLWWWPGHAGKIWRAIKMWWSDRITLSFDNKSHGSRQHVFCMPSDKRNLSQTGIRECCH